MKSASDIAWQFTHSAKDRARLTLLIKEYAQNYFGIHFENHNILYPDKLISGCQLFLNISKNYNELITVDLVDDREISFTINGVKNKKDIVYFEPIPLTLNLMKGLEFIERDYLGWFSQKITRFPISYTKRKHTNLQEIESTRYFFYKNKIIINSLHELQKIHCEATGRIIALKEMPVVYEKEFLTDTIKYGLFPYSPISPDSNLLGS